MAGHSKWKNILARKTKVDAARGKIFTKLGREIFVAVKQGGPDPSGNAKLKDVISKAKSANMSNDTINNAIKKAVGAGDAENYEDIVYEGYGPNGVALIVEASTDNKNRTAAEVRHAFDKSGGNLGTSGCVSYMFDKKGIIVIEKETIKIDEEEFMLEVLELGAEDFEIIEEIYQITTSVKDFSNIRDELENKGIEFLEATIQMIPTVTVKLNEADMEKLEKLTDKLDELDDVLNVYHNCE